MLKPTQQQQASWAELSVLAQGQARQVSVYKLQSTCTVTGFCRVLHYWRFLYTYHLIQVWIKSFSFKLRAFMLIQNAIILHITTFSMSLTPSIKMLLWPSGVWNAAAGDPLDRQVWWWWWWWWWWSSPWTAWLSLWTPSSTTGSSILWEQHAEF